MARPTDWVTEFVRDGFMVFPGLVDCATTASVRERIDEDLRDNYDPTRKVEYDTRSFCPDLRGSAPIMGLFHHDEVRKRIDELIGLDNVGFDGGQIAIRQAHNVERRQAPVPHIDGIQSPSSGPGRAEIKPFSLLVGVFLSDVPSEFAGNFTVWPASHVLIEAYFRQRGPQAMREGMPEIALPEPRQLLCAAGDVIFCHYQLAHAAAVNVSDADRYAVFFRVWHHELRTSEARWKHLTNIWNGWNVGELWP